MRILLVDTTQKTRAGLRRLSRTLSRAGHDVWLLLPESARENVDPSQEPALQYRFYAARFVPGVRYTLLSTSFYREIRTLIDDIDIVHIFSYFYPPCTAAAVVADRNDTGCIVTIDSMPGINWSYGNRVVNFIGATYTHTLGRLTFACADRVAVLGEYLIDDVSDFVSPQALEVIPNGINTNTYRPRPDTTQLDEDEPVKLLYVGRLDTVKGISVLLESFQHLQNEFEREYRLTVVGNGTRMADYKSDCVELGIHDRVTFTGYVEDTIEYYNTHDLFVLPSISEGQPNVVMEAQACGMPVVSTDVGGVADLIKVGEVVASRDSLVLANGVRRTVTEYDQTQSAVARSHIEDRYSIERMREEYLRVYEEVL